MLWVINNIVCIKSMIEDYGENELYKYSFIKKIIVLFLNYIYLKKNILNRLIYYCLYMIRNWRFMYLCL